VPVYQRQVKEMESEGQSVPAEEQQNQFSRAIQMQQAQSGVNITSTSKQTVRTNQFFLELTQQVSVQSGEAQLVDFLYNLGSGNSLIRVRDLALHPDPPRQQLSGTVKLVASYQKNPLKKAVPAASPAPADAKMVTSTAKRP
jgi:Tfp pilus assembly protein PilO